MQPVDVTLVTHSEKIVELCHDETAARNTGQFVGMGSLDRVVAVLPQGTLVGAD
ncbi:hypothetical protein D3C87_2208680 [compost metagenome]